MDHFKSDMVEVEPRAFEGKLVCEATLILKTSIWARSEDPRRLADFTGIPLGDVQEHAEAGDVLPHEDAAGDIDVAPPHDLTR